jgi:hypothetical protein
LLLADIWKELKYILEPFPGPDCFCIKDIQEGVDQAVACSNLSAVLVDCITVSYILGSILVLFRAVQENCDILW